MTIPDPTNIYYASPLLDWDVACNAHCAPRNRTNAGGFNASLQVVDFSCNRHMCPYQGEDLFSDFWNVCDLEQNPQGARYKNVLGVVKNMAANSWSQVWIWSYGSGAPDEAYDCYPTEWGKQRSFSIAAWAVDYTGRLGIYNLPSPQSKREVHTYEKSGVEGLVPSPSQRWRVTFSRASALKCQ